MTVPLLHARTQTCGGKAAALGALLRSGLPVPDGFVVDLDAYRAAAPKPCGEPTIDASLLDALAHGLDILGDPPVAVRSSAANEDSATASAAGQHESLLAVRGVAEVAQAVRACWASLHSRRAVAYRSASGNGPSDDGPAMAVLIQRFVDAEVSGVMFTPSGPDGVTEIEASWGLGPSVVGGTVTPDAYRITVDSQVTRTVADKRLRLDRHGTRLVTRAVTGPARSQASIDDATAVRLARLGHTVAGILGGAQDIEWAIADGTLWILQARPVTATPPSPRAAPSNGAATLTGTPGSHGTATGIARIVRGPDDFRRVRPGDILVCPYTDPAWTPLLSMAGGVVTEIGGMLSHAAIVARERRIPAVLGAPDATTTLRDGARITIDGSMGTVTMHS
jgi:pyruvate,water dikinase